MASSDLYCKIFVDLTQEYKETENIVALLSQGQKAPFGTIHTIFAQIDIRRNDDYKTPIELRSGDPNDSFLYWKFFLDVEPNDETERTPYISGISNLLQAFWRKGINAIAACDFEDELPAKGKQMK
jgi:hypothetical protein